MVFINEWLPNPRGSDEAGEWIELWNDSLSSVALSGFRLENQSGKKFFLSGEIEAGEYLFLPRETTKLTLRNTEAGLMLYDREGRLAHTSSFKGAAPEGKSLNFQSGRFFFSEPTPGTVNHIQETNLLASSYRVGVPIAHTLGTGGFFALLVGTGFFMSILVLIFLRRNENLSKLFFGGNEEIR